MRLTAVFLLLGLVFTVSANETNPSIMFKSNQKNLDYLSEDPASRDSGLESRCAEMSRQIDALRGKPQRRYIVIKRYEIECKGQEIDYQVYDHQGFN